MPLTDTWSNRRSPFFLFLHSASRLLLLPSRITLPLVSRAGGPQNLHTPGLKTNVTFSDFGVLNYVAGIDWDAGSGCKACIRHCQFGALSTLR
jgi:NAD-dependent dihydropyrimidine dehydrogenase PreA subunit